MEYIGIYYTRYARIEKRFKQFTDVKDYLNELAGLGQNVLSFEYQVVVIK